VVGINTSGSIGDAALSLIYAEVIGIALHSGAETHVLCFDETVYNQRRVHHHAPQTAFRALQFWRAGGTGFLEVIAEVQSLDPSVFVSLTDAWATSARRRLLR
jgi:predicted metal-dependent peptidase